MYVEEISLLNSKQRSKKYPKKIKKFNYFASEEQKGTFSDIIP